MKIENISEQYRLMQEGKSYSFDAFLLEKQEEASKIVTRINSLPFGNSERKSLFKTLFWAFGERNIIKNNFNCNFGFNIEIGSDCYINYNVCILDSYKVKIGNRVFIAPGVVICPVTHPLEASKRKELIIKEVVIEDDVWIGANSVIMPGVTLHKGCVVGACSCVKKDVEADTVVGGVPAKVLKKISN